MRGWVVPVGVWGAYFSVLLSMHACMSGWVVTVGVGGAYFSVLLSMHACMGGLCLLCGVHILVFCYPCMHEWVGCACWCVGCIF